MGRVGVFYQFEVMIQKITKARSKSKDKRRQLKRQHISYRGVRTSSKASMLTVFAIVFFFAMPTSAVFGQADPDALRNMQDMRGS